MLLGTAAYMSPEQARGKPVDRRTDIWAFGCVLFEMLTGTRAFEGQNVAEVLAGVIERQPDLNSLPATTPPAIRKLLRRSLEKDQRRRLSDIADARLEIDEAIAEPVAPVAFRDANVRTGARWRLVAVGSLLTAILVAGLAALYFGRGVPELAINRFEDQYATDIRFDLLRAGARRPAACVHRKRGRPAEALDSTARPDVGTAARGDRGSHLSVLGSR